MIRNAQLVSFNLGALEASSRGATVRLKASCGLRGTRSWFLRHLNCRICEPNSMEYHSTHVESLRAALGTLDVNDEHAKVKVEIESSKVHWSELASTYCTVPEGPTMTSSSSLLSEWINEEGTPEWKLEVAKDNVDVFRNLQKKYHGGFFLDENNLGPVSTQQFPKWMIDDDDGCGTLSTLEFELSSETPFAEGGQAELFHAYVIEESVRSIDADAVVKVFKEGTPLRDLLNLFPAAMLANDVTCTDGCFGGYGDGVSNSINPILGARLLKHTGRFAFLMFRAWGDLRKLINERMLHLNTQGAPFSNDIAFYILHGIAKGMMELHEGGIIHRDLKAANVLVFGKVLEDLIFQSIKVDPIHLQPYEFDCRVVDFECSVGVVGTGFWRAPEILEAVKNRNIFQKPELFTKQADVYSFGMICYEVLSGSLPFEGLRSNDYDGVISGERPMLPIRTLPWMVDLVNRCWHKDPSMRPPFEEIVKILKPHA